MRDVACFVLLLFLLAGCAGKAGPSATSAGPEPNGDVLPPGATNLLEGTVKTVELAPLEGVLIQLEGTNQTRETDDSGSYRFESLPPRDYIVSAAKEGYRTKTQRAVIEDDRIFQLDFVLDPVPSARPYHETAQFTGLIACQLHYQTSEDNPQRPNCGLVDVNNAQSKTFFVNPGAAQIVVELQWTPRTMLATELTLTVQSLGEDGVQFAHDHGDSVLKVVVSEAIIRKNFAQGGEIQTFVESGPSVTGDEAAADVGLAFQQDYTVHLTVFYHEIGPPTFSAIPPE